jgi:hypothetical protein
MTIFWKDITGHILRACAAGILSREDVCAECAWLRNLQFPIRAMCWLLRALDESFSHTLNSLGRCSLPACSFSSAQAAALLQFLIPLINCSLWYLVRNLRCTVTTDSVLANSKTQNIFLSPVLVMFRHNCHLAVKPASTSWSLLPKRTWRDSLPIDVLLSAVSVLAVALPSSEVPEGLMNYPVYTSDNKISHASEHLTSYIRV